MGPFPHDAPPARTMPRNPADADGFESVGHAHPRPGTPRAPFRAMGFGPAAQPASEAITLCRKGDVDRPVDEGPGGHAARFAAPRGPLAEGGPARAPDRKDEEGRHP